MDRRTIVIGLATSGLPLKASAEAGQNRMDLDGTRLLLRHVDGRLEAEFTAPTDGWLAVGFNNATRLKDTRFVIGALQGGAFHAEERIAIGPDHRTVQSLGLLPAVQDVRGKVAPGRSTMAFSLPHAFPDTRNPSLTSGTTTYLMRAWSRHRDFEHHSAWRRHISLTL
ncbi:MAG: DOMON domain-containing protein [Pseudomonadota bacterium]